MTLCVVDQAACSLRHGMLVRCILGFIAEYCVLKILPLFSLFAAKSCSAGLDVSEFGETAQNDAGTAFLSMAAKVRDEKCHILKNDSFGNSRKHHALSFDFDVWYLLQVSNILVIYRIDGLALAQAFQVCTIHLFIQVYAPKPRIDGSIHCDALGSPSVTRVPVHEFEEQLGNIGIHLEFCNWFLIFELMECTNPLNQL